MIARFSLMLVIVLGSWIAATGVTIQESGVGPDTDLRKKIEQLFDKRLATLEKRMEVVEAKYKQGQTEVAIVVAARDDLFQAAIDAADSPKERIVIRKKRFENLVEFEKIATQRYEQGVGTFEVQLAAKASRLKAEVEMLIEQQQQN